MKPSNCNVTRWAASILLVSVSLSSFAQSYPAPYPRTNATKIIDNDRINAWDVYWPKNRPTHLHTHSIDQVSITLHGGLVRVSPAGGPWTKGHESKIGSVTFVPAGTTHMEEGMSEKPQHKVMLEVKPSSARPDYGIAPPADGGREIFENVRLAAWDLTWHRDERVIRRPSHFDTVTVFLRGGILRSTVAGKSSLVVRKFGEVVYSPCDSVPHFEVAVGGSLRAIVVELK